MTLFEKYLKAKDGDNKLKIEVIDELMLEEPKIIEYIMNRVATCYDYHFVYISHKKVNGVDMLKPGYTKNTTKIRNGEKRYKGSDCVEHIEDLRIYKLQAKGAVEFEKRAKELTKEYQVKTNLTLPGKTEYRSFDGKDMIIELYDKLYEEYKDVVGLKSPN